MITFGGLASGLDTGALIDALVSAERSRSASASEKRSFTNQKLAVVRDVSDALDALSDLSEDMDSSDEIRKVSVASSNEGVGVTQGDGAMPGTYDLSVVNLARAETSRSFAFADDAAGAFTGSGTLGITVGADAEITVNYDATMSLTDLAAQINSSDARVNASVLFDGSQYRLQVSAQETGTANALTFTDSLGETGLTDGAAEVVAAEDAEFVINGTTVTRASNVVSDAIAGVTLELVAENTTAQVTVSDDPELIREGAQGYVDAFNEVMSQLNRQLTLTGERAPEGSLFGDGTMQRLQRQLGTVATASYGPDSMRLSDFGIEIGRTGELELDQTKFDGAVAADPEAFVALLEGAGGLSEAMVDLVDTYTDSIDGALSAKEDALQDRIETYDDQIERIDDGALRLQERLTLEFAALEQLMSELNAQGNQLLSLLGGLQNA